VQTLIDNAAKWFGSPEVKRHTQRDEAVLYGAAQLLYLALAAEGIVPGGGSGGGAGIVSSQHLEGVGSVGYAVQALTPAQEVDWLMQKTPFSNKLWGILATFPPGISTTGGFDPHSPFACW
jgi:hypothetical protein